MIILVDADDTLYNTLPSFLDTYNQMTGENVKFEDVNDWDVSGMLKKPELLNEIFSDPAFFQGLKLKEGAVELMAWLHAYHEVYIVTSGRTSCFTGKEKAFLRDFPFLKKGNIFYGWYKGVFKADVLIDDRVLYHHQFQHTNRAGLSIVADMPHNRLCDIPHVRVRTPIEAIPIIKHRVELNRISLV